jgi:hypothetical protein
MRRLYYIVAFLVLFFLASLLLHLRVLDALPIAFIGGCLGWAVAEFKHETKQANKRNSDLH